VVKLADAIDLLALCAGDRDRPAAARLLGASDALRATLGEQRWPLREPAVARLAASLAQTLSADAVAAARAEGAAMSVAELSAWVQRGRGTRGRPASGWASLTPTEIEVAQFVAAGLSNPDIAARMFISRATVKNHLAHVFAKLGVSSRAELAAMAARREG
jgi:DNA-binding CsgD family transcriptional regulator